MENNFFQLWHGIKSTSNILTEGFLWLIVLKVCGSFFRQIRKTCSILWFTWVFFEFLEARRLDKWKFIKWNFDKFSSASAYFWFDLTDCKLILENSNLQSWWCFRLFLWRTQHFPRIHIKVLRKIIIDLLYFWDVYDINLWEKKFGRSTAYSCRTNIFIWISSFWEKIIGTAEDYKSQARHFKLIRIYGFSETDKNNFDFENRLFSIMHK